jgi:hypothetical protein
MKKNLLIVAGLVLCAFAILGLAYWLTVSIGGPEAEQWLFGHWKSFETFLLANGFWLFAAIAVLPALILPVAPLLTLAGIWGGEKGAWLACTYASLAVIVNLSWTYWLAAGPGRGLIERLLSRTKYEIPVPDKENEFVWALDAGSSFYLYELCLGIDSDAILALFHYFGTCFVDYCRWLCFDICGNFRRGLAICLDGCLGCRSNHVDRKVVGEKRKKN